ncbi:MAG: hypothetical protein ACXVFN_10035 [Solirubrobacteraceae bacterium]
MLTRAGSPSLDAVTRAMHPRIDHPPATRGLAGAVGRVQREQVRRDTPPVRRAARRLGR